jgi:glycosyltransferase Alg8
MMTTFRERPEITTAVIRSILGEVRSTGLGTTIWLGSGDAADEELISALLEAEAADLDVELVIVRQDKPGKRYAIGVALRAMRRAGVAAEDIVIFMDGDAVIAPGMVAKCVPLFLADPGLEALTTDEEVVVHGPRWVARWLTMRFAQRRIAMQSHALSGKVLTLTGRLSLFRTRYVTTLPFIEILEEDHLEHWLWGRFRFLSGDDKSTWYFMLTRGARMTYVPDALSLTIEHIEGSGYDRMVQNLRRWSGNMLRNGARAIALGPRRVGFFIWWCVVDQRLAMWTVLVGPVLALGGGLFVSWAFVPAYLAWIVGTRLILSSVLWAYSRQVHLSYPPLLFVNQFVNAAVKVYCLFRLSKQRWTNRGDQRAGFSVGVVERARNAMAGYLTTVAVTALLVAVVTYANLLHLPSSYTVATLLMGAGGGWR